MQNPVPGLELNKAQYRTGSMWLVSSHAEKDLRNNELNTRDQGAAGGTKVN